MERMPSNYNAPEWSDLSAKTEKKLGLPDGLLDTIVNHGEKSNSNQVSEAGARTVYQITPQTRKLVLDKYGVDAYLSPENSAEAAGLLLKESLDRNDGNPALAVAEYHGGVNRENWGPRTKAYVNRVMVNLNKRQQQANEQAGVEQGQDSGSQYWQDSNEIQLNKIHNAYLSGKMTDAERAEYEQDVKDGNILLPKGASLMGETPQKEVPILPTSVADAYASRQMTDQEMRDLEQDVGRGIVKMPEGYGLRETAGPISAGDVTRAGLRGMTVGVSDPLGAAIAAGAATATGSKQSFGDIYSEMRTEQNRQRDVFRQEHPAVAIGAELVGALPTAIATGGLVNPAATVGGRMAQGAAIGAAQGGVYGGAQAAPGEVLQETGKGALIGGALGGAIPAVGGGIKALGGAAGEAGAGAHAAADVVDNVTLPTGGAPVPPSGGGAPVVEGAANAVNAASTQADDAARAALTASDDIAAQADSVITDTGKLKEFAQLARKAESGLVGGGRSRIQLAEMAKQDPEVLAAAQKMGIELPADVTSTSPEFKQFMGAARSIKATPEQSEWFAKSQEFKKAADAAMDSMEGSANIGQVSADVQASLNATREGLKKSADELYDVIKEKIPQSSIIKMDNTAAILNKTIKNLGGKESELKPIEKELLSMTREKTGVGSLLQETTTTGTSYEKMMRVKNLIGEALGNKMRSEPFGGADQAVLKRLYGALAEDQKSAVKAIGGDDLLAILNEANGLVAKRKALEETITEAFGSHGEGSIATKLRSAVKSGAKGDISGLNKMMRVIPEEMRKRAWSSAIMANARTPAGEFSPDKYVSMYQGMRTNTPIYSQFAKDFSKEEQELWRSMYVASKAMKQAEYAVEKTGKANQLLISQEYNPSGAIGAVMNTIGKTASAAVPAPLRGVADAITGGMTQSSPEKITAAAKLFTSPEFEQLIKSGAAGEGVEESAMKLAKSSVFTKFANAVNLPKSIDERQQFILSSMQAGKIGQSAENGKKGGF